MAIVLNEIKRIRNRGIDAGRKVRNGKLEFIEYWKEKYAIGMGKYKIDIYFLLCLVIDNYLVYN